MQSCGGECGNLGYLLHETAQALCTPPAACPPPFTPLPPHQGDQNAEAADGDLAAQPRSTSGPRCVDFSKKYRWAGNAVGKKKKKTSPEYKRHRRKIEPWGIFTFPSEIHFFLLVRLRIWSQMPRNSMKLNRDAAAERTAGKLQRARTEPHSSASPLKTLCNETQMCDARVGSRLQASGCGLAPVDVGPVLQDLSAGTHLCQCSGLSPLPQSSRRSAPSLIFVSALPPDMFNVQQLLKKNDPNVPCVNHGCSSKCPDCLPSQQLTPQLFFFLAATFLSVDSPAPAMFLPLSFSLPGKRKRPQ